jgi:phenylalanine-4-hydroxylase
MKTKNELFSSEDHNVWKIFLEKRIRNISQFACKEFLDGLSLLDLPHRNIPDHRYISIKLNKMTGWSIVPVDRLVKQNDFFCLLSQKKFPVIQKIRRLTELDFYDAIEPDLIHDYFGHCPLLMNKEFATFMCDFGKLAKQYDSTIQIILERFYWYLIEFGLIETDNELRIYGAGILPSLAETDHAIDSKNCEKKVLNIIDVISKPIYVGIKQPVYYVIHNFDQLYEALDFNWIALSKEISNDAN